MREYFTFYRPFKEHLSGLSDKDKLIMYEAIIDYALDFKEPSLEGFPKLAFDLIRPMLDANIKRWQNGCKGGAPKGNKNNRYSNRTTEIQPKYNQSTTEIQPNQQLINPETPPVDRKRKAVEVSVRRFIKPTLQELIEYVTANAISVDAERFFNYYEANGWKVGRNPMKDWKAALRTWVRQNQQNKTSDIGVTLKDNSTDKYNSELW